MVGASLHWGEGRCFLGLLLSTLRINKMQPGNEVRTAFVLVGQSHYAGIIHGLVLLALSRFCLLSDAMKPGSLRALLHA